jgi:DNA-directed RNA polymerase subunit RPC12/RpoP
MPSLKCPECGHELLPNDLVAQGDHIICGLCNREIYEKIKPEVKLKCPKCGEIGEGKTFIMKESCCCSK